MILRLRLQAAARSASEATAQGLPMAATSAKLVSSAALAAAAEAAGAGLADGGRHWGVCGSNAVLEEHSLQVRTDGGGGGSVRLNFGLRRRERFPLSRLGKHWRVSRKRLLKVPEGSAPISLSRARAHFPLSLFLSLFAQCRRTIERALVASLCARPFASQPGLGDLCRMASGDVYCPVGCAHVPDKPHCAANDGVRGSPCRHRNITRAFHVRDQIRSLVL